ncbi:MAG: Glycosyl transferase, family 2, partial [Candidatus Woesebacteria bacterium GW2011_GWB1_38_5]
YWEDVDISYRAMKRGYRVLWEPEAKVIHKHESTMVKINKRKRNVIMERNQLLFIWKNITSKNLMKKHVAGLFKRLSKHPGYIKVVFSALCKLKTVRRERKKEYKESKVSDEVIFASFNY